MLQGADPGDCLYAADSCGYGLLADDFQDADIANAVDVRAAAQLLTVEAARRARVGHGHDADVAFRVFVSEKGQGAGGQSVFQRGDIGFDLAVVANLVIDLLLDVAQLFGIDMCEMRKVEAHAVGGVERAGLLYVRAENIAQGGLHQVRAGVIPHHASAPFAIGFHGAPIADSPRTFPGDALRPTPRNPLAS